MSFKKILNQYGKQRKPCLFVIDFLGENYYISSMQDAYKAGILFEIDGFKNYNQPNISDKSLIDFSFSPLNQKDWAKSFEIVQKYIQRGDSYLLNLSAPTLLQTNLGLEDIFYNTHAKYKLLFKNQFVCFSPEIFIKVENQHIASYPMKGTIDANIPNAEKIILEDEKELAEHYTIVDLIRNDLNQIAKKIEVKKFRYIDKIHTLQGDILQVSSEIVGKLPENHWDFLGDWLTKLLPAGSISGAPKKKTIEIIQEAESFFTFENQKKYERGFYTGIFGYFDGQNLNAGVMIRFIENIDNQLYFKSGGGITYKSDEKLELKELMQKIYLPYQGASKKYYTQ